MEEIDGPELAPAAFDEHFRAQADSTLLLELWSRAWGKDYPDEVEPFSPCSWSLLSSLVDALRLPPDATLVDLGCGRGGPGLWLARAMNARLVGIDWSPVAVELAESRAPEWLSDGRYEMRTGTFTHTGLPDGAGDAIVSVDALALAPDPAAALAEVRRITAPGGRVAFTASEAAGGDPADRVWATLLKDAGLALESATELTGTTDALRRLYDLVEAHASELRADLGAAATDHLLHEAELVGPALENLTWILYVARSSADAGNMSADIR